MNAPIESPGVEAGGANGEEQIVLEWWQENIEDRRAPAGPRAELRRARTLEEVVFVPLYHDLRRRLGHTGWRRTDRLALVAGVLAQIREHDGAPRFAAQMAASRPGASTKKTPVVSPSRFRRLLRIGDQPEDLEQLFQQVRRMIALLDKRANVTDLARSLYWWNAETRKQWALAYYEKVDERALKNQ